MYGLMGHKITHKNCCLKNEITSVLECCFFMNENTCTSVLQWFVYIQW
jgi:hypothetical protein